MRREKGWMKMEKREMGEDRKNGQEKDRREG